MLSFSTMSLVYDHVTLRGLLLVLGMMTGVVFPLVDTSRILFVMTVASTVSHYMNFQNVVRSLTNRQHEVTFLMSTSNSAISHKKHELDDDFSFEIYDGLLDQSTMRQDQQNFQKEVAKKSSKDNRIIQFTVKAIFGMFNSTANPWDIAAMECDSILGNGTLMSILSSSNYDILVGDPAANLCTPLLAEVLSVPFIQYSVQGFMMLQHDRWLGQPIYPSFMPMPYSSMCDTMSFGERITNVLHYIFGSLLVERNSVTPFEKVKMKYAIRPELSLRNLIMKAQLHLVNSDTHVQDFPRPLLPNVIQVGGVTAKPSLPLEESLEQFFEGSGDDGVVVIALGTSHSFDEERTRDIARAMSRFHQRVLWLRRDIAPVDLGNNTRIVNWMPVNDVLGHPKTKVIVNHGGTSTVHEAIYHGVPMVLIPLACDMFKITDIAVCRGVAVRLAMPTLTGDILKEAIERVLLEPSFKETSSHLSAISKGKTASPVDTAVFWIEHVIKHGGEHLRSASAQNINFPQFMFIDILAIFVIYCMIILKALSHITKN